MIIEPPDECPPAALAAATARIAAIVSWRSMTLQANDLTLSMPHQVFAVRTARICTDLPLRRAVDPIGWRFLVRKGVDVKAAVQVRDDDGTWRVTSVKMGSWATETRAALEVAYDAPPRTPDVRARPSYLWCRATWTAALWFLADDADNDRVVPLPYARDPFEALTPYSAVDFMSRVRLKVCRKPVS